MAAGLPFPALQTYSAGAGLGTEFGVMLPPGRKVLYVCSTPADPGDNATLGERIIPTLDAALAQCRDNAGDIVYVLPGHAENFSVASSLPNLKAGVRIIGCGNGNLRPKFTWTLAAATVLLNKDNVSWENCVLNLSPDTGTVTVAAPITISGAGCRIANCKIRVSVDANSLTTIGITTTAGATDLEIVGNQIYGATAGTPTTGIQFVGAVRLRFTDNDIAMATSAAAVGAIRFLTTASTDIKMLRNIVRNNVASSTQAITGMAGMSGEVEDLLMGILSGNGTGGANAFSTPGNVMFGGKVFFVNAVGQRGALFGTAST